MCGAHMVQNVTLVPWDQGSISAVAGQTMGPVQCMWVPNHIKWTQVCVWGGGGKNNIKEGGPHGSMAPSGRLRRQLEKDKSYSPDELRRCLWCLLGSR